MFWQNYVRECLNFERLNTSKIRNNKIRNFIMMTNDINPETIEFANLS